MTTKDKTKRDMKLLVSFVAMIFVGLGNKSKRLTLCVDECDVSTNVLSALSHRSCMAHATC